MSHFFSLTWDFFPGMLKGIEERSVFATVIRTPKRKAENIGQE